MTQVQRTRDGFEHPSWAGHSHPPLCRFEPRLLRVSLLRCFLPLLSITRRICRWPSPRRPWPPPCSMRTGHPNRDTHLNLQAYSVLFLSMSGTTAVAFAGRRLNHFHGKNHEPASVAPDLELWACQFFPASDIEKNSSISLQSSMLGGVVGEQRRHQSCARQTLELFRGRVMATLSEHEQAGHRVERSSQVLRPLVHQGGFPPLQSAPLQTFPSLSLSSRRRS